MPATAWSQPEGRFVAAWHMRVLFDQGTPAPLRLASIGHNVVTAHELGWSALQNGTLLQTAESAFDVLVTTDRNLRHQQNHAGRKTGSPGSPDHQLAKNPPSPSDHRCGTGISAAW